ncbi:hypothetical protein XELAEV_18043494mg [Xenopus laevis]|uniref:Uncharacterized protein n=1 Tax=Xenopus laevis TaxID=8355 RepID=A0A974BWS0_XENLA|nr:hypothetical protein XELAEV_18043494mg [Xenopus laevis]
MKTVAFCVFVPYIVDSPIVTMNLVTVKHGTRWRTEGFWVHKPSFGNWRLNINKSVRATSPSIRATS